MSTTTRARASARPVLTVALVAVGLLAPVAGAEAAPRHAPRGPAYDVEVVGTRSAAPDGTSVYGTDAADLSRSGVVVATRYGGAAYVGTPRRTRELPPVGEVAPYGVYSHRMSPSGQVYAAGYRVIVRWTGTRVEAARLLQDEQNPTFHSLGLGGVNDAGVVTGCSSYVKIGWPYLGSFTGGVRTMSWPENSGNCSSGGISAGGVAAVTQEHPNFRTDPSIVYPRGATMTTAGITYLKAPAGVGTSADAISPSGNRLVGRTYADGAPTGVAWLSTGRDPVTLPGAGTMAPKAVTNAGIVLGVDDGRVWSWDRGRRTDLTSVSRLPRGWVLTDVASINDKGQIAATATVRGREKVAVRLSPVHGRR